MLYNISFYISMAEELIDNFDQYVEMIKNFVVVLIWKTINFLLFISRPLYILLFVLGVISYALPINTYKSKKILWGSIILMFFTEVVIPIIRMNFNVPNI